MNTFLMTIIIGISLSMDAFSLSLIYGTIGLNKDRILTLSIIVGLYHFFVPLLGLSLGNIITKYLIININILVSIIFTIIGIEMLISSLKEKKDKIFSTLPGFFLFGLSVSIDSFSVGIGLKGINSDYLQVSFIFLLVSFLFTYLGSNLGNKLNRRFGEVSTIGGGLLLIVLGLYYLLK